jgi:pimeloyl-ACP methyl ester carboxylesterase
MCTVVGMAFIVVLIVLVLAVAALLGYRKLRQRQVAKALAITTPNGIAEERYVRAGGIDQWIQIRGDDRDNPVLLVLHGGPGAPYAVFTPLLRAWERHFTVVQWDRRGAGKTLARNGKAGCGELTFGVMVDDAIEVAEFLRKHLRKDKLVVLAGSMGTMVGVPLVQRRPDLFAAYVGTDQYVDMHRNEQDSYRMTLDRARAAGKAKAVAALEKIGDDPAKWDNAAWMVKMRWNMATDPVTPNAVTKLLLPLALTSPIYRRLRDVVTLLSGFAYVRNAMFEEFMKFDARRYGTTFAVPVFIFQGDSDVLTLTGPAQEYLAEIEAPAKELALIERASHFAAFIRPDRFLIELVNRVRPIVG